MDNNTNNIQKGILSEVKSPEKILSKIIISAIIVSVLFGAVAGFMAGGTASFLLAKIENKFGKIFTQNQNQSSQIIQQKIIEEDSAVIDVVKKTSPAVISIIITKDIPKYNGFFDPFGDLFNPMGDQNQDSSSAQKQTIGGGSGFLVSKDGMIVTNKHVVEDMQADYTVVTSDGEEHLAKVLARHPVQDIAVIKIDGNNYPVLDLGDSDSLQVGQTVIAIGNSLGEFANSVSKGIVSGLKRNLTAGSGFGQTEQLTNIIQTDAAINPGNSGGPLLNISGNVIGVNVAMARGAENIGFALPINQVKKIVSDVEKNGKLSIPFLGIRYVIINDQIQKDNSLPFNYGALVLRGDNRMDLAVIPGSPADKAGIVENNIILEINGQKVTQDNQLSDTISKYDVGDTLTLKIWDKGQTKDVKITLEERK